MSRDDFRPGVAIPIVLGLVIQTAVVTWFLAGIRADLAERITIIEVKVGIIERSLGGML